MRVMGCGPTPCSLFFLGERPGKQESEAGTPFVGKSGKILDHYLFNLRLDRDSVYLDNLVKEYAGGRDVPPTEDEIRRDESDLLYSLAVARPKVVITLGLHSTRYFLGPDATMERDHGIPREIVYSPKWCMAPELRFVVFPVYHPASGLHVPELQPFIDYDFQLLDKFLDGLLPEQPYDFFAGNERYFELDDEKLQYLLDTLADRPLLVPGVDTEGITEDEWGLSISVNPGESFVAVKGRHPESYFTKLNAALKDRKIALHNSLHDLGILRRLNIDVSNFTDTMIMAYLLQVEAQGLKPLSYRHSGMGMKDYTEVVAPYGAELYAGYLEQAAKCDYPKPAGRKKTISARLLKIASDLRTKPAVNFHQRWKALKPVITDLVEEEAGSVPEVGLKHVPFDEAIPYSARDADATLRLYPKLERKIAALDLQRTLDLDLSVVPMIDRMQEYGIGVDPAAMQALGFVLEMDMRSIMAETRRMTGNDDFNIGSGDQVADFLFNQLGLTSVKMTRGRIRGSVDDKALEELKLKYYDHWLATQFITFRTDFMERQKLKGTYVDKLSRIVKADGRIHPHFRITRVVSGRFASHDPNVLAIPVRTTLGRLVRSGFVASPGRVFGSWDMDQIEMRVLAHESQDAGMIEVLCDPKRHIHKETTFKIYGIQPDKIDKDSIEYMMSKNISFGIVYGITAEGLRAQMAQRGQHRTLEQCQELINAYLDKAYPGVRSYTERCRSDAARYGCVRSMLGRLRYLPGIHSPIPSVRSEAERAAANHPIQAGATDIMKLWMAQVWQRIKGTSVEPLLPVHDELILEFGENDVEWIDAVVKESLAEAVAPLKLRVPVKCGGKIARDWGSLK